MSSTLRRILILVAVAALVVLVVYKTRSGSNGPAGPQDPERKTYTEAEKEALLVETVNKRWKALDDDDWVTIYSMMRPEMRNEIKLTQFIQGKDIVFYDNFEVLDVSMEGNEGRAKIKYDWGANLEMKIHLGEPVKRGVIMNERYLFEEADGTWYFEGGSHEESEPEK